MPSEASKVSSPFNLTQQLILLFCCACWPRSQTSGWTTSIKQYQVYTKLQNLNQKMAIGFVFGGNNHGTITRYSVPCAAPPVPLVSAATQFLLVVSLCASILSVAEVFLVIIPCTNDTINASLEMRLTFREGDLK